MNTTEKGKMFERIIKAIQQVLEPEDSIIHTNKKLNDTRGEIDILIVRKNGKKEYKIAIECKNYKVPVSVVDAFYGKCHRLSKEHKIDEIMIVATGFQRGAIEAADFFNIKLCSLEMVQRNDVLLKNISFKYNLREVYLTNPSGVPLPIDIYAQNLPSIARSVITKNQIEFSAFIRKEAFKKHKSENEEENIQIRFDYTIPEPIKIQWGKEITFYKTISGIAYVYFKLSPIQPVSMHQYHLLSHRKEGKALYVMCEDQLKIIYTKDKNPVFITPNGQYNSYLTPNDEMGDCLIVDI